MAGESINGSVTPEIILPDGGLLLILTEMEVIRETTLWKKPTFSKNGQNILPHHIGASTSSNSNGKPASPKSGETPHYLRASAGSCHDFCKYGRKHAVEVKPWRSIPKRIVTPSLDRRSPTESGVSAETKTVKVVKHKASPISKTLSSDSSDILKQDVSSPSKKVEVSSRQASSNEKKTAQSEKKKTFPGKHAPFVKPKTMGVKPLSSPETSAALKGRNNSEMKISRKIGSSKAAVTKVLASPVSSLSPRPSINRNVSLNVKKYRSLKLLSPLKDQNRIRKAEPKQLRSEKIPEKTLHVIKVETENNLQSRQNSGVIHSPPSPLLSSPKFSSLPKSPSLSFHEDETQEEFEYTDSEADDDSYDSISESSGTVDSQEVESSDANPNRETRKARVVVLEGSDSGGERVIGENQDSNADVRRRTFKKRGADDDTNDTDADSGKVVLRHQDVQGKKDAQGLLNNVIEETASKLVETRKSKVKALVGAFETVISLQESKPAT
ncbi:plant calmodulin-binding protein-like protein [Actinidia rufa]|uniref:Plant calmodulin-binding protein-like protein n=1 Tax=Actinidia rufa TaxID=165716 RepID=A0A7J0H885_9ERIC|nr:plant calmodulin-binding protein-like protein [Actinidia rufa]